jgi:hypothetical protein
MADMIIAMADTVIAMAVTVVATERAVLFVAVALFVAAVMSGTVNREQRYTAGAGGDLQVWIAVHA